MLVVFFSMNGPKPSYSGFPDTTALVFMGLCEEQSHGFEEGHAPDFDEEVDGVARLGFTRSETPQIKAARPAPRKPVWAFRLGSGIELSFESFEGFAEGDPGAGFGLDAGGEVVLGFLVGGVVGDGAVGEGLEGFGLLVFEGVDFFFVSAHLCFDAADFFLQGFAFFSGEAGGWGGGGGFCENIPLCGAESAGFFEKIVVSAGPALDGFGGDGEDGIGDGADEADVVADETDGAGVFLQGAFEGFASGDVEVGGGFVEDEEVGGIGADAGKGEADFFAAAEDTGIFFDIFAGEPKAAEECADLLFGGVAGEGIADDAVDALGGGHGVGKFLGLVSGDDLVAGDAASGGGGHGAGDDFEEGGFPHAVVSDEGKAVAFFEAEIEVAKNPGVVAIAVADLIEAHAFVSALGRGRDADEAGGIVGDAFGEGLHFFEHFDAALDLGGFGGLGAEAGDEAFHFLAFFGEGTVAGFLLSEAGFAFFEVLIKAVGVAGDLSAADVEDVFCEGAEQVSVV